MKKLFLTLLLSLSLTNCFGADLSISPAKDVEQVSGKQIFKASIGGDSDNVVIGDEKNPASFKNEITFKKWKNAQSGQFENSLSIIPPQDLIPSASVVLASSQLVTKNNTVGFYFNKSPDNDTDFKFGLILYEKPTTNTWSFQLEGWEEFDFFYQPPLTEEFRVADDTYDYYQRIYGTDKWKGSKAKKRIVAITETQLIDEDGKVQTERPEEIVRSYAVYHKIKRNNEIGKTNYKIGKIGNLFRPKFIDADGKWAWGNIDIIDGVYTVTCPQKFLDTAKYPIKANDTFGYTTAGSTSESSGSGTSVWLSLSENSPVGTNTLNYIHICTYGGTGGNLIQMALYSDDTSGKLIADATTVASTADKTFRQSPANLNYALTASYLYGLVFSCTVAGSAYYWDTGSVWSAQDYSSNLPATFSFDGTWRQGIFSAYCTYTPSAAGATGTVMFVN